MDPHSVEMWERIFENLPSPTTETCEVSIANRIIGDMIGYRHNAPSRKRDTQELANALVAYARLLQKHGVAV